MNIFNLFKKKIIFKSGALEDTRTQAEKDLDYKAEEIVVMATPVVWTRKTSYKYFPVRKQNGSGSCAMQSLEKERGIIAQEKYGEFVVFSANSSYQLRANPSVSGSTYPDVVQATQYGGILETLSPSQSLTDAQMMSAPKEPYFDDLAKMFGAKRVTLPIDIDAVASTIQATGKGVGLTIKFGSGEWFYHFQTQELLPPVGWIWGHRVVAVDYTLNDAGVKCLVIEDSACEDGFPQKLMTQSFFNARTYWDPNYIVNFRAYIEYPDRPSYIVGSIVSLQDCLKIEGLFPANQDSTGYFGAITKKGVIAFQVKYGLNPPLGNVGPLTKDKLRELYP